MKKRKPKRKAPKIQELDPRSLPEGTILRHVAMTRSFWFNETGTTQELASAELSAWATRELERLRGIAPAIYQRKGGKSRRVNFNVGHWAGLPALDRDLADAIAACEKFAIPPPNPLVELVSFRLLCKTRGDLMAERIEPRDIKYRISFLNAAEGLARNPEASNGQLARIAGNVSKSVIRKWREHPKFREWARTHWRLILRKTEPFPRQFSRT